MRVLAIDTALQRCSVAILDGDAVLSSHAADMERGHAEHLAPMTAAALEEAGLRVADLQRIGVVTGPGGFTGVRLAVSFARGLAIGRGISVVGVTSLEALAQNGLAGSDMSLIAPVIDARRGQVYASLVNGSNAVLPPFVDRPEVAASRLQAAAQGETIGVIGSGADYILALQSDWVRIAADAQIDARHVARLAARAPEPKGPVAPFYLRAPDAKPPKTSRLLRASPS